MKPIPVTSTLMSSGTVIWMPPMIATAEMVDCRSAKRALRRSISAPPQNAKLLWFGGSTQLPLRTAPDMTPI